MTSLDGSFRSTDETDVYSDEENQARAKRAAGEAILQTRDRRTVWILLSLTLALLIGVAVTLCVFIYKFVSDEEHEKYDVAFQSQSRKLLEVATSRLDERVNAIKLFSLGITSNMLATGSNWTELYLPYMEILGNRTNELANAISITTLPVITDETRASWEAFAAEHQGWRSEGLGFQERWANEDWVEPSDWEEEVGRISESMTRVENGAYVVEEGEGPFLPSWQTAPSVSDPSITNVNLLSHPSYEKVLNAALEKNRLILGTTYMPFENATETAKRDLLKIYIDKFKAAGNVYLDDPVTDLVMPINDMFFGTPNVVGLVHAHLEWRSFFADALPEGDGPLIATLHDLCSDMYSYRVTGPNVEFLGRGGHHELADPEHSYKVGFEGFNKVFQTNPEDQADGECFYMFHFHSEYTHQDQYLSHDPWLFALIVGCAFVFTSIIFIAYDCAVKRNQNKVMDSAVKSGAIVSALFPEAVRDRMYSEKPGKIHPKANDIRKFHRPDDPAVVELHPQSEDPVADLYPECTVLFADVVGFTAWASEKSPVEVFKFLETIYGHFDKIARQRGVFKVETIGDCYLAVSGLPKPQADHAVVMAKFAYGCHTCMSQLIPELVPVLGSSTAALKIRVGIHSGPVTAGVLRGDRARFQLFGDTVNTAARMESTGLPGRIHVSEQTAKLLVHTGHGNWVSKRTDLVEAKGKGMLQTYWISRGATSDAVRSERSGGVGSSETTTEDSEAEDARQKSIRMHTSIKDTYGKFS